VYANIYYGFDPHDYSTGMVIAYNEFYNNGYHGLILSRGCTNSAIHHNKMYNNAGHGFMLDRGSDDNQVYDNEMYANTLDGIAIYSSSRNSFTNNTSRDNLRYGLRINATYDPTDIFDGLAIDNVFTDNVFTGNGKYGINLYERADRNSFLNNDVSNNALYGLYVATGANHFAGNIFNGNVREGVYIIGTPSYAMGPGQTPPVPPLDAPGHANRFVQNTVKNNQLNGIGLYKSATDTALTGNRVEGNLQNGVYVKDSGTKRNLISQNSITSNSKLGIVLSSSANASLPKPVINSAAGGLVSGTARAGVKIELYRDPDGEGKIYLGTTTANNSGAWNFTLPAGDNPANGALTALAIDGLNNTSPFSSPRASMQAAALAAPEVVEEVYVTDEMFALEIAENQAAAAEDMQNPPDVDYSDALRELEWLEAEGEQARQLFLPLVVR
ncbi:MAG: right-handed parallel beta-helix repeat-containing protein, partial [Chloroflexota bacterium]|nr:right-handed parallel beta-helix repeat-containing protein [Chloroflexota bacterium]